MNYMASAEEFACVKALEFEEKAKRYAVLVSEDSKEASEFLKFIAELIREKLVR